LVRLIGTNKSSVQELPAFHDSTALLPNHNQKVPTMTSPISADHEPTPAASSSGRASSRPANAIIDLNLARASAQEMRGEWLTAVAIGVLTIHDLVEHAATPTGKALMRVTLRRLLLASPEFTIKQTDHILQHVNDVLGLAGDDRKNPRTIQWLLDDRTGGRRFITWTDATAARELPWLGWPATPRPSTTFR
jgi:hypothetical protein